jgi:hypothetical protein
VNYWWQPSSRWLSAIWGLLGGFAALCSPAIGAAWAVLTVASCVRCYRCQRSAREKDESSIDSRPLSPGTLVLGLIITATTSIAVVTPWTIRNRQTLGKWIPIKSNSGYELWQSQCLDDDGVLDRKLTSQHPYASDGVERQRYVQIGEAAYLAEKTEMAWSCVVSNPTGYLQRCGHRVMAAFVWYYPYSESSATRFWPLWFKRTTFPLAFLSILLLLFSRATGTERFANAATLYCALLLPYVLVSYGDRYAAPLLPVKCVLILEAYRACVTRLRDRI